MVVFPVDVGWEVAVALEFGEAESVALATGLEAEKGRSDRAHTVRAKAVGTMGGGGMGMGRGEGG